MFVSWSCLAIGLASPAFSPYMIASASGADAGRQIAMQTSFDRHADLHDFEMLNCQPRWLPASAAVVSQQLPC